MGAFGSGIPPGPRAAGSGVPATGPALWEPRAISGLQFWCRADQIPAAHLSATKVNTWRDLSGNGRDLTQGTDANRPTLVSAGLNGQPVVRFGPTASDINLAWTSWAVPVDMTCYAIVRYESRAAADHQGFIFTDNQPHMYLGGNNSDKVSVFRGSFLAEQSASLVDATVYMVRWSWTADGTLGTRVNNGVQILSSATGAISANCSMPPFKT
jgi:hypothetical protein